MVSAPILKFLGLLLIAFAGLECLPLALALGEGESLAVAGFSLGAGAALFFGVAFFIVGRDAGRGIDRRQALALTVLAWISLAMFGAIPIFHSGAAETYAMAMLEAMSGLTTTGLTVFADPGTLERSIVLWRAILQWLGGLATLLFAVALAPSLSMSTDVVANVGRRRGQAPFRPQFAQALKIVAITYIALTTFCLVALVLSGLPPFLALCYALATLSTGGFTPNSGGPAGLGNAMAEVVLIVFMLAGAMNFLVHWAAMNGRRHVYRRDPELAFWLLLLGIAAALLWLAQISGGSAGTLAGLREAIFAVVSAASTTGFPGQAAPVAMPVFVLLLLAGLALIGGASASTAGGIKLMRALLLLRQSARELQRLNHPHGVVLVKVGHAAVDDKVMQMVWSFFVLFVLSLIFMTIGLSATGLDFAEALMLALSALTNTGPLLTQVAQVKAGLGDLGNVAHWLLSAGMLVGRLEVFAVLVLLTPVFWQRRSLEQP
jgi:trk system potassium uptake protein